MTFWVYMLRCSDGSYYVGHTDDLERRVAQHVAGEVAGYTQGRRPVELVFSADCGSRDEALGGERQIKGWSRAKKEALIAGNWNELRRLGSRASALRDATSLRSAAPQDERTTALPPVRPEEGLSNSESPSRRTGAPPPPTLRDATSLRSVAPQGERNLVNPSARPEEGQSASEDPSRRTLVPPPPPLIVLVRPQLGENIGKAARAMLNFGLVEMRLVAPRDGWPNPDAGPSASGADEVLEQARVFDTLADAVADCAHVYATTVRKRGVTKPVVTPEEAAAGITARAGRSAIVFGPERSGLETDEVALARAILTVPVNPQFGSLNLAQAVILCAYEWSKHAQQRDTLVQPTVTDLLDPAPQEELDGMIAQLDAMLEGAGYFHPPDRAPATRRTLRTLLTKPGWNSLEIRTLRGVLSSLANPRPR